jgi:DNA-binding Lrp family transcriptional regulator
MDDLDRQIVAVLQLDGRATWREVARVVGASESTVARRGRQLLQPGLVRVTGSPDPVRLGYGFPVIVRVQCEAGASKHVARRLAARPDVRFLSLVTGSSDIVLELIVPSRRQLQFVLGEEFTRARGVTGTSTDFVLRTFKTSYDWSRALLGDRHVELSLADDQVRSSDDPAPLDSTHLHIIQLLGEDGRLTYKELADTLKISESMVRRRVTQLVEHQYLAFATIVDPEALGYHVEALISLRVKLGELEQIATALASHGEVRYLSATSGVSDLICEVILPTGADLYSFRTNILGSFNGIRDTWIAHELVNVKRGYIETGPIPWEAGDDDGVLWGRGLDES